MFYVIQIKNWNYYFHNKILFVLDENFLLRLECNNPLITLYVFSSKKNPQWKLNVTELINLKKK